MVAEPPDLFDLSGLSTYVWDLFRAKPTCPVDPEFQQWVDRRFRWLQDQFGQDMPCKASVILPTREFFPDRYKSGPDDVQALMVRVAGYMNVDPGRFTLFFYSEPGRAPSTGVGVTSTSGSAGVYLQAKNDRAQANSRSAIGIEATLLGDPLTLVATLAHEIGHDILLGQGRVTPDQSDHEPLTDLLTVFLGMGIFTANSTIRDRGWSYGGWHGWQTGRLGYLDQRTFGYALARFAWTRAETKPSWIKYLRPDVRAPLKKGLRFLASDCK